MVKADDKLPTQGIENEEDVPTEFEMVKARVKALEIVVEKMQRILKQNNLTYTIDDAAQDELGDLAWQNLH